MVRRLEYISEQYLNSGKYVPCVDCSIGEVIKYLQQFPPSWRISVGEGRAEPVLIDAHIDTIFTSIGQYQEP